MDFESLYQAHFRYVWQTLRRLGVAPDEAADCTQEVFIVVHNRLQQFEARSKVTTWLFAICYRRAQQYRRQHSRITVGNEDVRDAVTSETPGQEELVVLNQGRHLLGTILDHMTLEQRAVFVLYELEGIEGERIAEILSVSRGTVCSRLRAAREIFWRTLNREQRREHARLLAAGVRQ